MSDGSESRRINRRRYIKTAGLASIAGLSGCTSNITGESGGSGGGNGSNGSNGSSGSNGSGESYKIGYLGPMTGPASLTGENLRNGFRLGVEQFGGTILGQEVELFEADSESDPSAAVRAVQSLISRNEIDVLHGGFHSDVGLATMDVTAENDVPQLLNQSVSSEISGKIVDSPEQYWGVWKNGPHPNSYGDGWQRWGKHVVQENIYSELSDSPSIAMLAENTSYGRSTMETCQQYLSETNWEIVTTEIVDIDQTDYSDVLSKIQAQNPDVLWAVQTSPSSGASLIQNFLNTNMDAHVWHNYTPANPDYIEDLGGDADGVVWMTNVNLLQPNSEEFAQKYRSEHNSGPSPTAGVAYDTATMIKEAAEEAGSLGGQEFVDAYSALNYEGTVGTYNYNMDRHEVQSGPDAIPAVIRQIWDKQSTDIYPEEFATGEWRAPPWM